MSEEKHDEAKNDKPLLAGLGALDEAIRKSIGEGGPGSGIYALLSAASSQLLGVKAPAFPQEPPAKPEPEKADTSMSGKPTEPVKHEPPKATPAPPSRR